jgi:archaellum component FlaF (FlaF/FlaG flagellin family)
MPNIQDEEFNTFGITKTLRKGLVIGLLSLLIVVVSYLYYAVQEKSNQILKMQGTMYERLLLEQNRTLQGPITRMNQAADRTDIVVSKVDSVATNTDSLNKILLKKLDKK